MRYMHGGAKLRILLGLVLFAVIAGAGIFWHDFSRFAHSPLAVRGQQQTLDIARGSSFKQIVHTIRQRKLSSAPTQYWRLLAMRMGVADSLQAGEYALQPGITATTLLHNMATGKVMHDRITLVDGWTFNEVRAALAKAPKLVHDSAALSDAQIMQRIGAKGEKPEGRFLPETYAYVKGDSDLSMLKRAHEAMQKVLAAEWKNRDTSVPLDTPYQALILASIIDKENARADARARIAGVRERR